MGLMSFLKRLRSPLHPKESTMGYVGQPVQVLDHPEHYDKARNDSRIAHLTAAIEQWKGTNWPENFPEKFAELNAELEKHLKFRRLFHGGE
jgi:hypothetical protein